MTVSLSAFALIVLVALFRTPAQGPTIIALRIAVFGLMVTMPSASSWPAAFGWQLALPLTEITHVHAAWGLGGWSLLLVAGVSYLVVPMFQLTPPYPALAGAQLLGDPVLPAGGLVDHLAAAAAAGRSAGRLACAAALLAVVFAGVTLRLQGQRRRKVTEPTLLFWRWRWRALVVAAFAVVLQQLIPAQRTMPARPSCSACCSWSGCSCR